ncbi:MAG: hypothetical protein G8345_20850, partial [Magnetococcales bacterium]|nr:hypothetical protein [Magnetococcales bacterium]
MATGRVRILVTGVGGNVGQGILKALRASGLASWVVGCDCHPLSVGLFAVDRGYVVPPAPHSSFAHVLAEILIQEKIQLVLVGADAETLAISRLRDSLQQR